MHTYQHQDGKWSVGYWRGDIWCEVHAVETEDDAAAYVSYLHGGQHPEVWKVEGWL